MTFIVNSLLDTDLYKITMHAAIYINLPKAEAVFGYTNRTPSMQLNKAALDWLRTQIDHLGSLRFTPSDIDYLRTELPFLPDKYLEFIKDFKLRPAEQVKLLNVDKPEEFGLEVTGKWVDVTLYEIPLLSLISEAYFRYVDTNWTNEGQLEKARQKGAKLLANGCAFSEFGTRRRRSLETQRLVMKGLCQAAKEADNGELFLGTSNVMFAREFGVKPIGTVGHEWMMGIAAVTQDYKNANKLAMDYWLNTMGTANAGLALTDTFGTDAFLRAFVPPYSDHYVGVRQDSGSPLDYTDKISHHYLEVLKLPKFSKVICYSDSLNVDKCIEYKKKADSCGMRASFGIGTNLTNDFEGSSPLNIVIKLKSMNGNPAIKISDNLGKNMGDPSTVARVKKELGYVEKEWAEGDEAHRW
ncbi:hypothetical protein KL938_003403 [Ogataea parapolymorpha]|nr:hypothetical protein KL938_003403 [Ogataea parapolymorpha]